MNDSIIYTPRTGEEMTRASHGAPIYLYSDLCRIVQRCGIRGTLGRMFKQSPNSIILLQDPSRMNSGHWMGLSIHPERHEIYYFSTYGGKPDVEKNEWLSEDDQRESNQNTDIFNDGLKQMQKEGWTIHYNDHPYQKEGDGTATCGIYTVAFMRSGLNPDQFYEFTKRLKASHPSRDPAVDYYKAYFA